VVGRTCSKSATTSRDGGMRMAPGRGRGHLCWWPLIFKKNILISVLSELSILMITWPIDHWQYLVFYSWILCWLFNWRIPINRNK
jgi:hypothetical protein